MSNAEDRAKTIFLDALEIPNEDERAAYVQSECGDDAQLFPAAGESDELSSPGEQEPQPSLVVSTDSTGDAFAQRPDPGHQLVACQIESLG